VNGSTHEDAKSTPRRDIYLVATKLYICAAACETMRSLLCRSHSLVENVILLLPE